MILPHYAEHVTALDEDIANAHQTLKDWDLHAPDSAIGITAAVAECHGTLELAQKHHDAMNVLLTAAKAKREHVVRAARGKLLNRLPTELLTYVLEHAGEDDWWNKTAWAAARVDRYWRALALRLPFIWSHIFTYQPSVGRIKTTLDRSRNHPLIVRLSLGVTSSRPYDEFDQVMDLICATSHRWISVQYNFYTREEPLLERLRSIDAHNVEDVVMDDYTQIQLKRNPMLRKLRASYGGIYHRFAPNTTYDALHTLDCELQTDQDIIALSACPNVRQAVLQICKIRPVPAECTSLVTLLRLTSLRIPCGSTAAQVASLLRLLDLPQLKQCILDFCGPQDFTLFNGVPLHQLEKLQLKGCSNDRVSDRRNVCRISILLRQMPNLRELTLIKFIFDRDLSEWAKQPKQSRTARNLPFVTQLRNLTLINCEKVNDVALKEFLPLWSAIFHAHNTDTTPLRLTSVGRSAPSGMEDVWDGVIDHRGHTYRDTLRETQFSDDEEL